MSQQPSRHRPGRTGHGIPWILALAVLSGAPACQKDDPGNQASKKPKVGVRPLVLEDWADRVEVPATVLPAATVNVIARVPGRLAEVRADEGAEVAQGDVIAVLDPRDLRIAVQAAEGQAAMARAGLDAATVQRDNLARDGKRFAALKQTGSVSESEAEKLDAALRAAEAQVGVAKAQLQVAQAGLEAARRNLSDATVKAPIDGVIVKRTFDVGQETAPAAGPLVILAAVDPLRVEGSAPEAVMSRIAAGAPARVRLDALPGETFEGTVELVGPAVDPLTKMVRVRVALPNPVVDGRRRIAPGMSAVVSVTPEQGRYFSLPLNAVRRQDGDRLVILVAGEDGTVREKKILPVRKEGLRFLALDGLAEGDKLVIAAPVELEAGTAVDVTVLDGKGR